MERETPCDCDTGPDRPSACSRCCPELADHALQLAEWLFRPHRPTCPWAGEELDAWLDASQNEVRTLRAELDRQRALVRAAEALVECDAAKPGLGQSISVWRRQRRELLDALAAAVRAPLEGEGR